MNTNYFASGHKEESNHSQRKKDKDDGSNVSLSENPKQSKGQTKKDEHMPLSVDNYADNPFNVKCICDWSKDDKYGFIPNTKCPVHGKRTLKQIKKGVPLRN